MKIQILDVDLITGGGGEAKHTQRLRRSLTDLGWSKRIIEIKKIVDDEERVAVSHEIDHVRKTEIGAVALEIEWNNKDPFFDRDLENFQRLHSEGVISVGVIVTRGKSLQENLAQIIMKCAANHGIKDFDDLVLFKFKPTDRQRQAVNKRMNVAANISEIKKGNRRRIAEDFVSVWTKQFVQDKFGTATTHWNKLQDRVNRGVGNPCPLLFIGIPSASIHQGNIKEIDC